jgi:hypothetical protein
MLRRRKMNQRTLHAIDRCSMGFGDISQPVILPDLLVNHGFLHAPSLPLLLALPFLMAAAVAAFPRSSRSTAPGWRRWRRWAGWPSSAG